MRPLPDTVELTINLLINAIAATLKAAYGYRVYARELRQGFIDPCFFIEVLPAKGQRIGFRRLKRFQPFVIHFFAKGFDELQTTDEVIYVDDEPTDEPDPQADEPPEWDFEMEVYDVADSLYRVLELVEISNKVFNGNTIHVKGSGMGYTVSSGVLHFNVNFNYHLLEERLDPYMEVLHQTILPKSMRDWEYEGDDNIYNNNDNGG